MIELLAVIVILAIIALIAVPVIMNIIDKANKSAFKDSAYGIINAGELYFAERQLEPNGMLQDEVFDLSNMTEMELKGEIPEGKILITKEGKVALAVKNNRYCITKGIDDVDVTIIEDYETCELPNVENNDNNTSLITFTIFGGLFQALEGMTWGQWLESEYNADNYIIDGNHHIQHMVNNMPGAIVALDEVIVANGTYSYAKGTPIV